MFVADAWLDTSTDGVLERCQGLVAASCLDVRMHIDRSYKAHAQADYPLMKLHSALRPKLLEAM